jgi:phosphoglycolate phosphatase-like HAD superfamily hydrolase
MLYLFDIDGTLVDTGGAGMAALKEATREVFGHEGPPLDLAGSTDLGIVANIHAHFEIEPTRERIDSYFQVYHTRLDWNLSHGGFPGRVLEGVRELLAGLSNQQDATIGLLTGNTAGGAAAKMRHFGLAGHFPFGAYGCDHADRNRLGPIALERAALHAGVNFTAAETWIIGDTPKDIACAHSIGARCLAVATGQFSAAQLMAHGADQVLDSLEQVIVWT